MAEVGAGVGAGIGTKVGTKVETEVGTGFGAKRAAGVGPRTLASARDRARLRERESAERARVEQVLARGPLGPQVRDEEPSRARPASRARVAPRAAAPCVCRLCGGGDVALDFVFDRGTWQLARCGRCDFIWTERAAARPAEAREAAIGRSAERFAPRTRRPGAAAASAPGTGVGVGVGTDRHAGPVGVALRASGA